jgi:glycopeptide antibiotics resistance protein
MIPIALLHFITGSHYQGPFPLFVNSYLIDILLPFGFYFLLCLNDTPILDSWLIKGALIFLAASSVEMVQYKGFPLLGRTFDPWDILMYGLGVLLAIICDQLLFPRLFSFWQPAPHRGGSQDKADQDLFFWRHN